LAYLWNESGGAVNNKQTLMSIVNIMFYSLECWKRSIILRCYEDVFEMLFQFLNIYWRFCTLYLVIQCIHYKDYTYIFWSVTTMVHYDMRFYLFSALSNNVCTGTAECRETEMCVHCEISAKANRELNHVKWVPITFMNYPFAITFMNNPFGLRLVRDDLSLSHLSSF